MANISAVVDKYFTIASETYENNLSGSISALAATVPVNSANAYADGDNVVLTVEPGTGNEASFVGTKASSPDRFVNCQWTEGNLGVGHASGVTIVDYDSATHHNLQTKGLKVSHNDDGTLKSSAVQAAIGLTTTPSVGWNVMAQALTYTGNLGNGEFTGNFTGDVTGFLQPGMKLLVPRSTTSPTQSMLFVQASSQYATKAAPAGTLASFTGSYTAETWIYLNSYGSNTQAVMGRYDNASGVGGWGFQVRASGQLQAFYVNGSGPTSIGSRQIVPLKRWTHIAASVTVATKVIEMFINGVLCTNITYASAANSLVQLAVDFRLGAYSVPANTYLDGYLGESRVWNVARTQAQILADMNTALTGAEANLVGCWQGNGNFNDKTANANHLTSSGGASATALMSTLNQAYANNTEYFFVSAVGTFSGGLTPVTLYGGADGHLPNAALGTAQYSNVHKPFGFPVKEDKWGLGVWDTVNGNTIVQRLLNIGIQKPLDHVGWYTAGTATGVMWLSQIGSQRFIDMLTDVYTNGASATTTATFPFPTLYYTNCPHLPTTIAQISQAAASVGGNYIIGSITSNVTSDWYMANGTGSPGVGGRITFRAIGQIV